MFSLIFFLASTFVVYATLQQKSDPSVDTRIIGGSNADIADYPYTASLQVRTFQYCGGVIIGLNWVVTAAHCVADELILSFLSIRVGSSNSDSGGQVLSASRAIVHPNYNEETLDYDIALLNLVDDISTPNARSVRLLPYQGERPLTGLLLTVTGWGDTSNDGDTTTILQSVEVPAIDQITCRLVYAVAGDNVTDRMFCAGDLENGGKDACQGDSGGPIVYRDSEVLFGIVSWGTGCARPGYPGVYTSVGMLRNWIESVTGI